MTYKDKVKAYYATSRACVCLSSTQLYSSRCLVNSLVQTAYCTLLLVAGT